MATVARKNGRARRGAIDARRCFRCRAEVSPRGVCDCADGVCLILGDCRTVLPRLRLEAAACVTDPPYELGFMGRDWDRSGVAFDPATWGAVAGAMLPGAHLLAFGGTRTHHRIWCAIEDAGFAIRDTIMWVFGSGFPKSLDVRKAIDKAAGVEREETGRVLSTTGNRASGSPAMAASGLGAVGVGPQIHTETAPATEAAQEWQGWGTALKPAFEPIVVARKPLCGTVAENCQQHGCGALNVDGCRVELASGETPEDFRRVDPPGGVVRRNVNAYAQDEWSREQFARKTERGHVNGRHPANLIHDGSDEVLAGFPDSRGDARPRAAPAVRADTNGYRFQDHERTGFADSGSAARFFYCAKAARRERGAGNKHPTVKPLRLMEYLCRLVSQPGQRGLLIDPFAGSGSTLLAATRWFERVLAVELDPDHCATIAARLSAPKSPNP